MSVVLPPTSRSDSIAERVACRDSLFGQLAAG